LVSRRGAAADVSETVADSRRSVRPWLVLAGVALLLNAGWELAQRPLYAGEQPVWHCLRAALVDAACILAAAGAAAAIERRWGPGVGWCALVGGLAAVALAVELWALETQRWAYDAAMPTIGGVGLCPLLQLPALGTLAVLAARRSAGRRRAASQLLS
jgi:peptidoglycan/LPS O-acetylase OafA/YrhL